MNLSKKNIKSIGIALCALLFLTISTNSFGQILRVSNYGNSLDEPAILATPYLSITVVNNDPSLDGLPTTVQTFSIPVDYDGSALGTTNFTVGTGNDCTADLTNTPREVITPIYTLDCVPTAGPSLR